MAWEEDFLNGIGAPITSENINFVNDWNAHEGNLAGASGLGINNPFNTTLAGFGGVSVNSAGVKSYPSLAEGIQATIQTLRSGAQYGYNTIIQALQSGNPWNFAGPLQGPLGTWGTGGGFVVNDAGKQITNPVSGGTGASGPAQPGSGGGTVTVSPCQDWSIAGATLPGTHIFCAVGLFFQQGGWGKILLTLLASGLIIGGGIIYVRGDMPKMPVPVPA